VQAPRHGDAQRRTDRYQHGDAEKGGAAGRSRLAPRRHAGAGEGHREVALDGVLVRRTAETPDHAYGDGVSVASIPEPASARVEHSLLSDSARAGLVSFGAVIELGQSSLRCNAIALDGELSFGLDYEVVDRGGNVCGCRDDAPCQVLGSMLTPPEPLP
jgi:hypothetical protein